MVRRRRCGWLPAASIMAAAGLGVATLTGCAARSAAGPAQADGQPPPAAQPLGVSVPGLSWAVVRTGGPSAGGWFWQLLIQDRAGGRWRLATPPGVADTGGLAVTRAADGTITAGFVPSDLLRFSPLAMTSDAGAHWSQGLLPAGLVAGPASLAAVPGARLVAVTAKSVQESEPGGAGWRPLVTLRQLAFTPPGRRCGLTDLTGAAAEPGGTIMVAGGCARAGAIGLFAETASGWQPAGPGLPSSLGLRSASVAGLLSTQAGTAALITGSTAHGGVLIPAWLPARSTSWRTGAPVSLPAGPVTALAASSEGTWAVLLGGRQALVTGRAQPLTLPGSGAAVVTGVGGGPLTALVPGLDTVTVWRQAGSRTWQRTQVIDVPSTPGGQSH